MADRRLQVFHTVARLLSFTKAAETLHMTQPAVTFQVRQLEEYFNTRLFDRTHNRISLTEAGARVYEYSDKIFELYGEMENAVREMTGEISGSLTIGASTTIAEYMLPALLGDFRAKYPDVSIHLKVSNTDGIVSMVENNAIDLVIATTEGLYAERGDRGRLWGSVIKQTLKRQRPGFSEAVYGFSSFSDLLEEAASRDQLELERDEKSGGYIVRGIKS